MKILPQEHYLRLAWVTAYNLSKDPDTKVGAIITTPDHRQISIGYNGFPKGMNEDEDLWSKPEKYEWIIHAELNAVINCPFDTQGCIIYITHQPCHKCMGLLVNAGISEVYYDTSYYPDYDRFDIAKDNKEAPRIYKHKVDSIFLDMLRSTYDSLSR